jgi:septum site-determining protein MinC
MSDGRPASDFEAPAPGGEVDPVPVQEVVVTAPQPAKTIPSLVVTQPVRSGQSLFFPEGDVTIVGSVASGAEIVAGGSIHVYGTLRGRAMAGTMGNGAARIFCRRLEAELIAIDGFYKTAEDLDPELHGRAVQIWLEGEAIKVETLG